MEFPQNGVSPYVIILDENRGFITDRMTRKQPVGSRSIGFRTNSASIFGSPTRPNSQAFGASLSNLSNLLRDRLPNVCATKRLRHPNYFVTLTEYKRVRSVRYMLPLAKVGVL